MESALHGLIGKVCLGYFDDIITVGKTCSKNLTNLELVFTRLQNINIAYTKK